MGVIENRHGAQGVIGIEYAFSSLSSDCFFRCADSRPTDDGTRRLFRGEFKNSA